MLLFHLENYFYFGYKIFIPDNIQDLLFLIDFPNICQPESHQSQRAQTAIFSTAVENNYYFYDALTREGKNGGGRKIIYIYTHTHMHVLKAFPLLPLPIEPNESLSLCPVFFFFFFLYILVLKRKPYFNRIRLFDRKYFASIGTIFRIANFRDFPNNPMLGIAQRKVYGLLRYTGAHVPVINHNPK